MLTPSPALATSPLVDTHLALLRATPLGAALGQAAAPWIVDTIRPTVRATHFLLSHGLSELHVAIAGGGVVEESWRVEKALAPFTPWEAADELSSLGFDLEGVADDVGELLTRLGRQREESGAHSRRRLDLMARVDTLASEAFNVAQLLRALSDEASDLGDHLEGEK